MYKFLILAVVVSATLAEIFHGEPFVYEPVDFSDPKEIYGRELCEANGRCECTEIAVKLSPIPHNCQALCRNDYKATCASAYYDRKTRLCHILSLRCVEAELLDKELLHEGKKRYVYFRRLIKDSDENCDNSGKVYEPPADDYSDRYCLVRNKKCPGLNMYGDKNWKNKNKQFCLDKASRILTSVMIDWVPNPGQNPQDADALGTCYHKINKCTFDQLVDQANSFNFLRLLNTETTCPLEYRCPPGYCHTGDLQSCHWIVGHGDNHLFGGFLGEQACYEKCNSLPTCKFLAYGQHGYCELHTKAWCQAGRINQGNRFSVFWKKDNGGQDCAEAPHHGA